MKTGVLAGKTILVTGATGLLGGRTLAHLLASRPRLRAVVLVRDPRRWDIAAAALRVARLAFLDEERVLGHPGGVEQQPDAVPVQEGAQFAGIGHRDGLAAGQK